MHDATQDNWWNSTTMPFSTLGNKKPALFKLQQVDDNKFLLLEPFKYISSDGREIPVTKEFLGRTDLASIPSFLGWFARRHGRHTPAALMHDQLITSEPERLPKELQMPVGCVKAFMQLVGTHEAGHQGGRVGAPGLAEPPRPGSDRRMGQAVPAQALGGRRRL